MSPRSPRRAHVAAAAAVVLAAGILGDPTVAAAQPGPGADAPTRAEALYDDAVRLMSAGRDAEACPLLAESQALDPALGTLLALARCQEKTGKLASAWGAYLDVAARAARAGQGDREAAARKQAAALEGRLPRLTIELGPAVSALRGVRIVRDGSEVGTAIAGTAVPVDPGEHVVELHAEGRITARARVVLAEREARRVVFDALEPVVAGPATAPRPGADVASRDEGGVSPPRIAGVVLVGAGAATLGVGSVLGILASGANDDSIAACAPFEDGRGGSASAYRACTTTRADAAGLADASTVLFVAGAALASAGVVLIVIGGDDEPGAAEAHLAVGPGAGGLAAWGAF